MVVPERTPIVGADDSSIPIGSSPSYGYSGARRNPFDFTRRRTVSFRNPCLLFLVLLFILRLFFAVFTTPDYGVGFLFVLISLLPAAVVGWFILSRFRDEIVGRPFLFLQFLIGAIPLILFIIPLELITTAAALIPIVFAIRGDLEEDLPKIIEAAEGGNSKAVQQLIQQLAQSIPLWAIILSLVLIAYVTAGTVEEVGKWLVARRYIGLECICGQDERKVGCRGIMASACMAALGFATIENIGYVSGMARAASQNSSAELLFVFLGLFRGLLAFPVHVGTQLYVAITASQRHIFMDDVSVPWALFHAILFHGTFDVLAFLSGALVTLRLWPAWIGLLVPVIDIIMVVLLLLVCRARYKALLERERMAMSEPV
ncbi:unnamed protein product [Chondrus crispus]|uniref:PrsW family intramembrane metalloprotease n=1 Tax=Chondrus crispus TaxID=2769 RepID=R7QJI0_CHOCR|nr:unnamed protein product [Chondrus crispus]CDF37555.1 unnamed protein product [Chondrus crispus]|eukprot:XP_005717426.1 unnamed protein product [Chondrus crispus]